MQTTHNEKGKQVFIDNIDVLLTDKIVKHTRDNADKISPDQNAERTSPFGSERDTAMKKRTPVPFKVFPLIVLAILGVVAFLLYRRKFTFCNKK
jgi:hypothetical protein